MKILLFNTNPVVSRLVSLCMRDSTIDFKEVSRVEDAGGTEYDIVFIDDASYHGVSDFLKTADIGRVVFFSSRDSGDEIGSIFDTVIKKPFLPSEIQQVIDDVRISKAEKTVPQRHDQHTPANREEESEETGDEEASNPFLFPLSEEHEREEEMDLDLKKDTEVPEEPKVLDHHEIEQIKALLEEENKTDEPVDLSDEAAYEARKIEAITRQLEEEGLEIVEEDEIFSNLGEKVKKRKKKSGNKHKMKNKKKKKNKETVYTMEEALLAALENMKPKKIKKLLKGAEVTLRIRFKDEE